MDPIISLRQVNHYYEQGKPSETHALRDINIDITPGEYVSFLGPSGCGKTTLLYAIAGIELPTEGEVMIEGKDLRNLSPKELAIFRQRSIGIVFQNFNLIPTVKNLENVAMPMAFSGVSAKERLQRAQEIFEKLGIRELADRYPYELSGGQQQRIGIARALANDPPVILADEPLGNLDSQSATTVLDILRDINRKEGKTVIMVTHEAWSLRDVQRIFYLRDGAVIKTEAHAAGGVETHYKNLFPELGPPEIRAKLIAGSILRGYTQAEVERLEKFLADRLGGKLNSKQFQKMLDLPYKEGGVGLWKQKAQRVAEYVEEAIGVGKDISKLYHKMENNPEATFGTEIERIREWLLADVGRKLRAGQKAMLDRLIADRLAKRIDAETFRALLNKPIHFDGVGLNIRYALVVSEKLEGLVGNAAISTEHAIVK